jgi:SAM-dependent methyltransferase
VHQAVSGDLALVTPPFRLFGGVTDQEWLWLCLEGRDQCPFLARYLPGSPTEAIQLRVTRQTGKGALETAAQSYLAFRRIYEDQVGPFNGSERVLDFGCGWGRIIRFFLRDVEPENLVGIDIDEVAIAACRDTNHWSQFHQCPVLPPTDFGDATFDFVYAYSVFSHLSEEAHLSWLEEFNRILKPQGVLILTTLPRSYIEHGAQADEFSPSQEYLRIYDEGGFCYHPLDEASNPHFGLASIPERYVKRVWSGLFDVQEVRPESELPQVVIVCTKKQKAEPEAPA